MSKSDTWMPLYIGDYLRDTGHLSTLEHGAYLLLLMQAWARGGSLPTDDERLRALARMDRRQWAACREAVLAFFTEKDGELRNARMDKEIDRVRRVSSERQRAGRSGSQKRWSKADSAMANANAVAIGLPEQNHPYPQPQSEKKEISAATQPHPSGKPPGPQRAKRADAMEGFEEFWRHYPRKVGKGEAERAWPRALAAAGGDVDLIIGGVKVALGTDRLDMREGGRFCPHPATWLNGKRWLDGLDPEPDPQPTLLPRH